MQHRVGVSGRLLLVVGAVAALMTDALLAQQGPAVRITFELNDAQVKGAMLAGVEVKVLPQVGADIVASGTTDAKGRWSADLPAGSYRVSYALKGFVPYTSGVTEMLTAGQVVTVSLSRMLEDTGKAPRSVRIILNWGSAPEQVRDVDSHLACPCNEREPHISYQAKVHEGADHKVALDVDDTDWGGPETITLSDPRPGNYVYWVHDYSGPGTLGASGVVVRVVIGSQEAGEFRVFKGVAARAWRPFKGIEVGVAGARAFHPRRDCRRC
jgi:hypothetical protein